jgi:gamma-glutamylcyclotransferase (GGCT)/AIG2-like uncharacterized protein YtfP
MTDATEYLFVYGTLRAHSKNDMSKRLKRWADKIVRGRTRGRLYMIAEYPGFVPSDSNNEWVYGDVYHLPSPELVYSELDRYEGCSPEDPLPHEYQRSVLPILLESGDWVDAFSYVYARDTAGKPRIESGEYRRGEAPYS